MRLPRVSQSIVAEPAPNEAAPGGQPLVSVLLPTYDRPDYLRVALASVVAQTYENLEVLVSDNNSPRSPEPIVAAFRDPRIRFHRHATNVGMTRNALSLFTMARGTYVTELNDDDVWDPRFVETLVGAFRTDPAIALAFCDHHIIRGDGRVDAAATEECSEWYGRAGLRPGLHRPFLDLAVVRGAVALSGGALIRREVVDWSAISPEIGGNLDRYIAYLCARDGLGARYVPERLMSARAHAESDLARSPRDPEVRIRNSRGVLRFYGELLADERARELWPWVLERRAVERTSLGIGLLRVGERRRARGLFLSALRDDWTSGRAAAGVLASLAPTRVARRV